MKIISHRGNLNGPEKKYENNPDYLNNALLSGFDVEIDVWYLDEKIFLGHDKPQYEVNLEFIKNDSFWCHAKNIDALSFMVEKNIHCFFHNIDDVVLTSKNYLWTYPGKKLSKNSICVESERKNLKNIKNICAGVCTDYPLLIEKEND